jgi:hypothetical protein
MAISNSTDRFNGYVASLAIKAPCVVASNANLTLSGEQTVNGIAVVDGDRVLVNAQTDQTENGIWVARSSAWERAPDFDGNRDAMANTQVVAGVNGGLPQNYRVNLPASGDVTVGTTAVTFEAYSGTDVPLGVDFGTGGVAGRVAFWDSLTTIGGDSDFTFTDGPAVLTLNGTAVVNQVTSPLVNIESSSTPTLWLDDTDAGSEVTTWSVRSDTGQFIIAAASDDRVSQTTALSFTRIGTDVQNALFNGMNVGISGGSLRLAEIANAPVDATTYGQFWVQTGAPGTPMFTNESGSDQLIDPSISEIVPVVASYGLTLADKGKTISFSGSTPAQQMTIPANASVAYPIGTFLAFDNSGSVSITVAIASDTLTWADDNTTGARTMAAGGYAVAQKISATNWKIAGKQLT